MTLDYVNYDYHKTHKSEVETDSDKWCMITDTVTGRWEFTVCLIIWINMSTVARDNICGGGIVTQTDFM